MERRDVSGDIKQVKKTEHSDPGNVRSERDLEARGPQDTAWLLYPM